VAYSQLEEEKFILDFFKSHLPKDTFFCDVGAFDGMTFSNTRALYERGWSGILIEPHPLAYKKLQALYIDDPQMSCLQYAAGDRVARGEFIDLMYPISNYGDLMLSSCNEKEKERWPHLKRWTGVTVPVISLREVLDKHGRSPEFLSIDCEGMDIEVLESACLVKSKTLPSLIMVEHNENRHLALSNADAILKVFGYTCVYTNPINAAWTV
jgi:FkbM family methyltransferase